MNIALTRISTKRLEKGLVFTLYVHRSLTEYKRSTRVAVLAAQEIRGYRVTSRAILGGLHHKYGLEKEAA
jgi:hypothetical protein